MTEAERWWKDANDAHLLRGIELGENSLVFDVGGYKGDFTALIRERFHSNVFVYEPVLEFSEYLEKRFADDVNVVVQHFGLGGCDRTCKIALMAEASTLYSPFRGDAPFVPIRDVASEPTSAVSLLAINAEGSEYEILERLIDSRAIGGVKQILVQFHENLVQNAEGRRTAIGTSLAKTHDEVWSYPFVWEFWKRRA